MQRPHQILRALVGLEIADPEAHAIDDRRTAEVDEQHFRCALVREFRGVLQRLADDRLHDVRRHVVARTDFHLQPQRSRRLASSSRSVSFASTLFGTTTKLPALVRIFVARQVISLTMPSCAADRHPVADAKRLLDLNRQPGETNCRACPAAQDR